MSAAHIAAIVAAGAAGLASLPHCFAMCGPLAAAGCAGGERTGRRGAAYLAGRLLGYAAVGALLGGFGAGLLRRVPTRAVNSAAALLIVAVCLYQAARHWRGVRGTQAAQAVAEDGPLVTLRVGDSAAAAASSSRPGGTLAAMFKLLLPRAPLGLGLATALLPCGSLLAAWLLAAATLDPLLGALSMVVFGIASSPALLLAILGKGVMKRLGVEVPAMLAAAGWLLVAGVLVLRVWLNQGATPCH